VTNPHAMTRDEYIAFHARRMAMLQRVLEKHVPTGIERALDIGGAGDKTGLSPFIRDTFKAHVYSVDLGDDVAAAKEAGIESRECNIDTEPIPYEDAWFDLVVFASVIEHLYNPHRALEEIARVLKPGGLLLVEAPNAVAFGRRLDALRGNNPFRWFNEYNAAKDKCYMEFCSVFYTAEEVEALLAPDYEILERRYGLHTPRVGVAKKVLREALIALVPGMSDCFAVIARRK
jgi:SAM-dependent methyltransferase